MHTFEQKLRKFIQFATGGQGIARLRRNVTDIGRKRARARENSRAPDILYAARGMEEKGWICASSA